VLLRSSEVYFAESDGNDVWLATEQGRLRAATQGLDKLDAELIDPGFLRVHRRYVVNLNRIREIERGCKGEMLLIMDGRNGGHGAGLATQRRHGATSAGYLKDFACTSPTTRFSKLGSRRPAPCRTRPRAAPTARGGPTGSICGSS
jgi:hypothetical protein